MFAFSDISPFEDLFRLRREMNHIFNDFDRNFGIHNDPFLSNSLSDPFFSQQANQQCLQHHAAQYQQQQQQQQQKQQQHQHQHQQQPQIQHKQQQQQQLRPIEQKGDANSMNVEERNNKTATDTNHQTMVQSTPQQSSSTGCATTVSPCSSVSQCQSQPQSQSQSQTAPATIRRRSRGTNDWLCEFTGINLPKCDVIETNENYLISCELPGMSKEDVKINVTDNGIMTITAERSASAEQKDPQAKYHRIERHFGKFQRSLPLPKNVELDKVSAKHDNGLLKIELPKKHLSKTENIKQIQIQ